MANKLNKTFLKDPLAFLRTKAFLVKDQAMASGDHLVQFKEAAAGLIYLEPFTEKVGFRQHPFRAYFLKALPDNRNEGVAFSRTPESFFFTSTLNGCQFLAFGAGPRAFAVQHNNHLHSSATNNYDTDHTAAVASAGAGGSVLRVRNGVDYNAEAGETGNIVGIKGDNGWAFYFQKQDGLKRRVISVTELRG